LDTCLAQDARAESTGILLRVNRHPHLLACDGVLQQQVAALPDRTWTNPAAFSLRITSAHVTRTA
jgi:hypothetical protein